MPYNYCCCAIPILNSGIYLTIAEQTLLAVLAGTLTIATPNLVGASLPSFVPWIFAIVCYVIAGIQALGFLGVFKENTKLYKTYIWLNAIAVHAAFGVAAACIGISAARHKTAETKCQQQFFQTLDPEDNKSQTLCNIFAWVGVGLMGGLWLLLIIVQEYFLLVTRQYGKAQSEDHQKYYSVYSAHGADNILMDERPGADAWDARPSNETIRGGEQAAGSSKPQDGYGHVRQWSNASSVGTIHEPYEKPNANSGSYPPRRMSTYQYGTDHLQDPYVPQATQGFHDPFTPQPDNATHITTAPTYYSNLPSNQQTYLPDPQTRRD